MQCSALSRKAAASSTHARHWGEGVDVIQELVVVVILGVFSLRALLPEAQQCPVAVGL